MPPSMRPMGFTVPAAAVPSSCSAWWRLPTLGAGAAAWTGAGRARRGRRLSGADAGCLRSSRITGRFTSISPWSMRPLLRWRDSGCGPGLRSPRSCSARCGCAGHRRRQRHRARRARVSCRCRLSRWSPRCWSAACSMGRRPSPADRPALDGGARRSICWPPRSWCWQAARSCRRSRRLLS